MLHVPSALFYGFISTILVFGNKFLLSYWSFKYPIAIILCEMALNICFVGICKYYCNKSKSSSSSSSNPKSDESVNDSDLSSSSPSETLLDISTVKKKESGSRYYQFLTSLFYSMHAITALKALSNMNIPMYVIFKRLVPLANLILSFHLFDNPSASSSSASAVARAHHRKIILSICIMTLGVVVAGLGDIGFDLVSYVYCSFSVVCQALYFSFIQKCGEHNKNAYENLFRTTLFSFPILFFFFIVTNEATDLFVARSFPYSSNPNFWISFVCNILVGTLLSFSQFWCTINNNAITTSVVGVLKSMIQTLFGFMFFNGYESLTLMTLIGILINLVFGTWYTYLKYTEKAHESSVTHYNQK